MGEDKAENMAGGSKLKIAGMTLGTTPTFGGTRDSYLHLPPGKHTIQVKTPKLCGISNQTFEVTLCEGEVRACGTLRCLHPLFAVTGSQYCSEHQRSLLAHVLA